MQELGRFSLELKGLYGHAGLNIIRVLATELCPRHRQTPDMIGRDGNSSIWI
jgi:hypothetical protein